MKPVWTSRTTAVDEAFLAFSTSIKEDAAFLSYDIQGSIAHVKGLGHVGLLSQSEQQELVAELTRLGEEFVDGTWTLDAGLEDGHMNLEAELTHRLGDLGKRLHTGRSRNDQVATCIVLYGRDHLARLATQALAVSAALAKQADAHQHTPWTARTHGQPAQPATIGFLLMGHAFRLQDAAKRAIEAREAIAESPLGSGAVAGSTLPLDPAFTAALLGLRSPRNALLATGARDAAVTTLEAANTIARSIAGLAADLLLLYTHKHMTLPSGLTTGSSLMPQKRNPDVLELARGTALSVGGHLQAAHTITAGLGLGYMRDFQVVKIHLHTAVAQLEATLPLVEASILGATFQGTPSTDPGVIATDLAEMLVAQGIPFRAAYDAVAGVYRAVEDGMPFAKAVAPLELGDVPADASRRDTLGGPAPVQVQAAILQHAKTHHELLGALA